MRDDNPRSEWPKRHFPRPGSPSDDPSAPPWASLRKTEVESALLQVAKDCRKHGVEGVQCLERMTALRQVAQALGLQEVAEQLHCSQCFSWGSSKNL